MIDSDFPLPFVGRSGELKLLKTFYSLGQAPFIALCREWVWAAAITQQLNILPQKVGTYWDDQMEVPEFPIAVADLWKKKMLVGVSLWENGRFTPAYFEELIQKMYLLPQATLEGWCVGLIVFGRRPFTAEIHEAAAVAGVRLVMLAQIEPLLLMAREARRREQDNPASEPFEF